MKLAIGISITKSFDSSLKTVTLPFSVFAQSIFLISSYFIKALEEKGFTEFNTILYADNTIDIGTSLSILVRKAFDDSKADWVLLLSLDEENFPIDMPERCEALIKEMDLSQDGIQGFPESNIYLVPKELVESGTLNFSMLSKIWQEELNEPEKGHA